MIRHAALVTALACCTLFSACVGQARKAVYVGVMVDNHEIARPYQRGLEQAAWVQEQFVEGMISRYEAVYEVQDFPASVGPVRSIRSYFVDGAEPIVSAVFHAGGSPDALQRLASGDDVASFNALKLDRFFAYDDRAPAPHHRFLEHSAFRELSEGLPTLATHAFPFPAGSFKRDEAARWLTVDMHSKRHDSSFSFDELTDRYTRSVMNAPKVSTVANVIVLETDVAVAGELGRLGIRMTGSGRALLFRDGGVARGEWSKQPGEFFSFTDDAGQPFGFRRGQVWMLVVDDLARVAWSE